MAKDKISIIMSTYDSEETIESAIKSIVQQTFKNFELLISDDCSNDNTYKICAEYEKSYQNIKLFRNKKNMGLTLSLNKLIEYCSGNYIARHDSDDFSAKNRLEEQLIFLKKFNLDGCGSRAKVINSKRIIPGFSYYLPLSLHLKYKNPLIHGTLLIKKEALQDIGGYDEDFLYAQDYKLITDLIRNGYNVRIQNKILYYLNMENNISSNFRKEQKYYADCAKKNIKPVKKL
tara:strand:- start:22745 stop:23440 length:696 start_codon:yes stop_codon:yes gene_type:complete